MSASFQRNRQRPSSRRRTKKGNRISGQNLLSNANVSEANAHTQRSRSAAATATTTNLGLAVSGALEVSSDVVAFSVDEGNQGNTDLNGDGDLRDLLPTFVRWRL